MPSPFPLDQLSPEIRARYGLDHKPWGTRILVAFIVVGFAAAVLFVGFQMSRETVQYRLLAWDDVATDRVDVTFEVRRPADQAVTCIVRAQDSRRIDVGYAVVDIPSGEEYTLVEYPLRTVAPAFTAELLTCGRTGEALGVPGPQFPPGIAPPEQPWSP